MSKAEVIFAAKAFDEYNKWLQKDKKVFRKLQKLIKETRRKPFEGAGQPEALKHELSGYWSRRIVGEHRLVYKVSDEGSIVIAGCMGHYLK